jgi:cytochrome c peroxidase
MNRALKNTLLLLAVSARISFAAAAALPVEVVPRFHGQPLVFDTLSNKTGAGQAISVTRLDFLLSNIALRGEDGMWHEAPNVFACILARNGRTRFELENIPSGNYDRVRFAVGLEPDVNHSDAARRPAEDPLNPQVNGLHWGWMGGYVFLALEGSWLRPDGRSGGYSWHLANDASLMRIELPAAIHAGSALRLTLAMDKIVPEIIDDSNASTHSRANDPLAGELARKVEEAFAVEEGILSTAEIASTLSQVEIGPQAVAYPLTFARYFPRPALPTDNPLTVQGVELGRRLFQEKRLSVNNSQSCAACHSPARAFNDGRALSVGAEGANGTRNAPALFNLAWKLAYFWDGRAATLRAQVLQPIQNPVEMHQSLETVSAKLPTADYAGLFADAFGSPQVTPDRIARALEQYLLTLVSYDSKFDRMLERAAKFTAEEQRGFELFHTEYDPRHGQRGADCFHCHGGPLFQSQAFANNGLDTQWKDAGRKGVTGREGDVGKFAVPSLRNVELTAPYMHDGRFATLEQVVEHYCTGVKRSVSLDPNLAKHPDGGVPLSQADKNALVAFLKTLTDERFRPANQSAVSTTPPEARRSGQHFEKTENKKEKEEKI